MRQNIPQHCGLLLSGANQPTRPMQQDWAWLQMAGIVTYQGWALLGHNGRGSGGEGKAEAGDEAVQDAQGRGVAAGQVVSVHCQAPRAPVAAVLLKVHAT